MESSRRSIAVALSVTSLLLGACAWLGGQAGPIAHPSGDALILRVSSSGGFVGPGWDFANAPSFSLQGDGRVIVPVALPTVYPGPALPGINVRKLTEAGIQAVLAEVIGTGLFAADHDYRGAQGCVMDASDTIFTLHAAGRDETVTVYGLGTLSGGGCPGMSSSELKAHEALVRLADRLGWPENWLPEAAWVDSWQPFHPDAMRLIVRNADQDQPDGSGIASQLLPWPAGSDPATFGDDTRTGTRCGVVSGADSETWYSLLREANQLTRFTRGDHRYAVQVRFLLPDEPPTCALPAR
jgi:hypothetical protein